MVWCKPQAPEKRPFVSRQNFPAADRTMR